MPSFRVLDQSPVYFDLQGRLAAGGSLKFYAAGTTTPADVYGDQALTVNNGSTIAIGSDGRAVDDLWGSIAYRVRLYAADGTLVSDDDNVQIPGGTGTSIPTLSAGKFLTNDGAVLAWDSILQPPDPTGQSGKVLSSDGTNVVWIDKPSNGASADVTVTSTSAAIGSGSGEKFFVQSGTATADASGTHTTTKAVAYGTPFKSLMAVVVMPASTNVTAAGFNGIGALAASSTSGFTVQFDINEASGSYGFVNPVGFQWVAFGTVAG
jgi:hypothetical protein